VVELPAAKGRASSRSEDAAAAVAVVLEFGHLVADETDVPVLED
jgi:uncharacterized protein involved in propanediol utilization